MELDSNIPNSPKPGDTFFVRMNNGAIHAAEILETRAVDGSDQQEYFVHYLNFDHRNDQWITESRLSGNASNEQMEMTNEQLNDSTNSLTSRKRARLKRRLNDDPSDFSHECSFESADQIARKDYKPSVKYIEKIWIGQYEMDCWYHSPFPDEYGKQRLLYICEYCMKYMRLKTTYSRHLAECSLRRPPGIEIYRDPKIGCALYEVDGAQNKLYCQNLCLLARLFLESKVICFNVSEFLFYVLMEYNHNNQKERFIGYFSKEKDSAFGYNLSCLLCLPPYQRKGYGKLLIQFSYELSKLENAVGGPEKPVSDLGHKAYLSYWTWALLNVLKEKPEIEVDELSAITSISTENCLETLSSYGFIKYWRQGHFVCASRKGIEARLQELHAKTFLVVNSQLINWQPRVKGKAGRYSKTFAF
ncbi:unnamed protein product [Rotaria magnacalcarata]|uniref:Histone acetyltransferase n=1 Tax=Rotaria magnacalcarata TaxID=392030 RepID=A0A816KKL3_9BILA|nr:unnamed protein product [Rotaria magnacalcarata]CAF1923076.1 unnamed protein product [Rotaria magnacalcarata]CAF2198133.1 unnamed protein product [Rotaria magnacalcarata]CAF4134971.1 unnamed protein product [Rotaria magnacalcarata]CAF4364901.1 unnamed protein product [Rotaria magnacalcarata]